jgi:hypothetical protein
VHLGQLVGDALPLTAQRFASQPEGPVPVMGGAGLEPDPQLRPSKCHNPIVASGAVLAHCERWSPLWEAVEEGARGEHGDRAFEVEQVGVSGH